MLYMIKNTIGFSVFLGSCPVIAKLLKHELIHFMSFALKLRAFECVLVCDFRYMHNMQNKKSVILKYSGFFKKVYLGDYP